MLAVYILEKNSHHDFMNREVYNMFRQVMLSTNYKPIRICNDREVDVS